MRTMSDPAALPPSPASLVAVASAPAKPVGAQQAMGPRALPLGLSMLWPTPSPLIVVGPSTHRAWSPSTRRARIAPSKDT